MRYVHEVEEHRQVLFDRRYEFECSISARVRTPTCDVKSRGGNEKPDREKENRTREKQVTFFQRCHTIDRSLSLSLASLGDRRKEEKQRG